MPFRKSQKVGRDVRKIQGFRERGRGALDAGKWRPSSRAGMAPHGWGNDTRVGLLLPERARSECARSTAAVRPNTGAVPKENKRASLEGAISMLRPCGTDSLNILMAQNWDDGYPLHFEVDLPGAGFKGGLSCLNGNRRAPNQWKKFIS